MRKLILFICISLSSFAQENYFFEHYSLEKGLSQGSGYAVSQYDDYMWLGTQDGLNRYDGYNFDVFRSQEPLGVNDNFIQCFLTDSKQRFWVATVKGICLYDTNKGGFKKFDDYFKFPHILSKISVRQIIEDKNGGIWLVTDEIGIFRFDIRTKTIKQYFEKSNNFIEFSLAPNGKLYLLSDNEVYAYNTSLDIFRPLNILKNLGLNSLGNVLRALVSDKQNNLWLGTYDNGVFVISEKGVVLKHLKKGISDQELSSNDIKCFLRDRKNNIWIGTRNGGISLYNSLENKLIHIKNNALESKSLGKNYVLSFFEDKQANIWVGLSGGGFDKYDPRKYPFQSYQHKSDLPTKSISDHMVFKIFGQGQYIYFGTQAGGMSRYDTTNQNFKTYKPDKNDPKSILHSEVYDISADNKQNLWLATGRGLCQFYPKTQTFKTYQLNSTEPNLYLYAAQVLHTGSELWAGGQRGLFRFDLIKKQWSNWANHPSLEPISKFVIRIIFEDSTGDIWLGTLGHGIIRYSPKTKKIVQIDEKTGLLCANIRSFYQEKNELWVGTDCGLYRLNMRSNRVEKHFNSKNGLVNNVIYGIVRDNNGKMWLSSNKGLMQFDAESKKTKNFTIFDGLTSNEFNTNCFYKNTAGKLYFGSIAGVSYFNPNDLKTNLYSPKPKFTKLKVLDSLYRPLSSELKLNYTQNFIDFEYATFNFSNSESNTYQHQLVGIDENWVVDGQKNTATYTNLPPGNFQFKVRSKNADGVSSTGILTLNVAISPPFWQSYWFKTLFVGLLGLITYIFFKQRIKQIEIREARKTEMQHIRSQAEMIALKAQINPHFIFNCLNTVDSYVLSNQKKAASDFLQTFSQLMRMVLENSGEELVTIQKDLEALKLYTSLEEERFEHEFETKYEIDVRIFSHELKIPPMLLQPFVENAILHGLRNQTKGNKNLLIRADLRADSVEIRIKDSGIGRKASKEINQKRVVAHKSKGLELTISRIKALGELHQKPTQYEVKDLVNGTEIRIHIPIIT